MLFARQQNPSAVPNPEQTASTFLLAFYTFVSYTISKGYSKGSAATPLDIIPPLADYDTADVLVDHSFKVCFSLPYRLTAHLTTVRTSISIYLLALAGSTCSLA
jgi:hypothetical protein